jgi:hypothetical protein
VNAKSIANQGGEIELGDQQATVESMGSSQKQAPLLLLWLRNMKETRHKERRVRMALAEG